MGKQIRAVYTDETVRVYQAYKKSIADEAVEKGTFGSHFKMERMTWIKPSFLWMMYRCGWGKKENQEHILAIDIKREAFDFIVKNSVLSTYKSSSGLSFEEWQELIKSSEIRCQWDPERDIRGRPIGHRSIQLGLRGDAVRKYVNEWIVGITDITDYVRDLDEKRQRGEDIIPLLPEERVYIIDSAEED